MIKILLIRHAMTDYAGKRLTGRSLGIPLNDEGHIQAKNLAERLSGFPVAAIYSSPLERAVETATPIAGTFDLPCVISADFNEIDFGKWTDMEIDDLVSDPVFRSFNLFRSSTKIPDGESMAEAQMRIVSGIEKIRSQHIDKTVAIISHADLIKSAIAFYAGIHLDMMERIVISPASVSIIEIYDETARLVVMNSTENL
jgi:probable phosphoglycerate mutase